MSDPAWWAVEGRDAPGERDARIERFDALRRAEFRRLETTGIAYLDYTASSLYPASLVRSHADRLCETVLGNPHSENGPSTEATEIIERTRRDVLDFFDADPDEWTVCFTANASTACKLVGEAFPFEAGSRLVLFADNHNSVNGIREYARSRGADVSHQGLDDDLRVVWRDLPPATAPGLLAFPAQSNFSGVQHPLEIAGAARRAGYRVLLDAAAFVPTNRLSLAGVDADFVCVSFYKMFGFPTGVGCLLARRDALEFLRRPWFSGGTVEWVTVETGRRRLLQGTAAFEDGTTNFLDIAAVSAGLGVLRTLGMHEVHAHVMDLTLRLLESFAATETGLGRPLIELYGPKGMERRGATVAFNLLDDSGVALPYEHVERAASEARIAIRGGCFCNPGASEAAFGVDPSLALACLEALPRGDFHPRKLGDCLGGAPVGALRASFGLGSNATDVDRLVDFLVEYAVRQAAPNQPLSVGVQ